MGAHLLFSLQGCVVSISSIMSRAINATIVVPTYQEAENIELLVRNVFRSLREAEMGKSIEMIIVDDDSRDGTVELVGRLREQEGYNVRTIVRKKERGLSSAVMRGFDEAKGEVLLCMDADLQHPPESVPALLEAVDPRRRERVEFAIGSRFLRGRSSISREWPPYRQVFSRLSLALLHPITALSDPFTGFFALPASVLRRGRERVNLFGMKIAIELFIKCQVKSHSEVPIFFGSRNAGASKMTAMLVAIHLFHIASLYWYQFPLLVGGGMMFVLGALTILASQF